MKKKIVMILLATLITSSILVPIVAADSVTTEDTTFFTYGVSEGDEFIYNVTVDTEFGFVNDEIYENINDLMQEENNSLPYQFDTFNMTEFMAGLEELISQEFDIKLGLNDMYREIRNESYGHEEWNSEEWRYDWIMDGYEIENNDVFNGSIRMKDDNDLNNWVTPNVISKNNLDDYEQFVKDNFNLSDDDIDYLEDEIHDLKQDVDSDDINWDNLDFYRVGGQRTDYYPNGTVNEEENDPNEPEQPIPDFNGAMGVPFYLPSDWNFTEWGNYLEDMVNYEIEEAEENDNETIPFESFADMREKVGITQFHTTKTSVGFFFNLGEIDWDFFEDFAEEQNETIIGMDDLEDVGIKGFYGGVASSIEYSDEMSLIAYKFHINGTALLDLRMVDDLPEEIGQLEIEDEEINIVMTVEIVRDGYFAPSLQQILDGELGEERDPTKDPDAAGGLFGSIPGFPLGIVAIIGLLTVSAITLKYKYRK